MKNCEIKIDGSRLTIAVDLTQDLGPSKSGLTRIVATTAGNVTVGDKDPVTIGLNVYRKIPKEPKQ